MDLTPETLRSATFRDKLRGYHPDDVDEFLESVARGLEVLLARLRDATEKARHPAPVEPPLNQSDEAVKTLALAQRTADLAIQEAKAEAERLAKAADQKARGLVAKAEESAVAMAESAQAELRADLERLQHARDQLWGEVQSLTTWLEGERGRIRRALIEVADRVDVIRDADDAPQPKPVSVPDRPRKKLEQSKAAGPSPSGPVAPPAPPAPPLPMFPKSEPAKVEAQKPEPPKPEAPKTEAPKPPSIASEPAIEHARSAVVPQVERPKAVVAPPAPAPAPQPEISNEDDPFFAALRDAMRDQSPLGPRDDE